MWLQRDRSQRNIKRVKHADTPSYIYHRVFRPRKQWTRQQKMHHRLNFSMIRWTDKILFFWLATLFPTLESRDFRLCYRGLIEATHRVGYSICEHTEIWASGFWPNAGRRFRWRLEALLRVKKKKIIMLPITDLHFMAINPRYISVTIGSSFTGEMGQSSVLAVKARCSFR